MFPYVEPILNDNGTIGYTGNNGYKYVDGEYVPMNITDLRSLIGRKLIIHNINIGGNTIEGLHLYLGPHTTIENNITFGGDYGVENIYSSSGVYAASDEHHTPAGSATILTCVQCYKNISDDESHPKYAEAILWVAQNILSISEEFTETYRISVNNEGGTIAKYLFPASADVQTFSELIDSEYNKPENQNGHLSKHGAYVQMYFNGNQYHLIMDKGLSVTATNVE